jgi:hypothetical protein
VVDSPPLFVEREISILSSKQSGDGFMERSGNGIPPHKDLARQSAAAFAIKIDAVCNDPGEKSGG